MNNYIEPSFKAKGFSCCKCGAYSNHDWADQNVNYTRAVFNSYAQGDELRKLSLARCQQCGFISFWLQEQIIWPLKSNIELPLDEMPEDIKLLYNEAKDVFVISPKSSCAILRLGLQKFCNMLANKPQNSNLDETIKELVKNGLPELLQKSMDTIRVIGNEAVHPGQIDIDDNKEVAKAMFKLMNIIVEKMIIEPKEIEDLYKMLPESKRKGIESRNFENKK